MKNYLVSDFLSRLGNLNKEQLASIKGIGPILADNIITFTQSKRFEKLSQDFIKLESRSLAPEIILPNAPKASKYLGKTFVITGSFEISRDVIKDKLEQMGATVSGSISKNTDYLLAGEKAGSKLDKAQNLGIKVITSLEEVGI
jgi:DNA ligase (NAD+)